MIARIGSTSQHSAEVIGDELIGGSCLNPDDDFDILFGEEVLGTLAHASGENHVGPLLVKPLGQNARLVRWWR